jgi:OmcA/MtrC family decaheme c-type cytochrome
MQGGGAGGTLTAAGEPGTFRYVFPPAAKMPDDATGSYTFALEGGVTVAGARFFAHGPTMAAAVTDAQPVARRVVVEDAACNRCHDDIQGHGGMRKGVQSCVLCHNPENVNDERVARLEGTTVDVESVDLKVMIHKIHRGEGLEQSYILGGNPGPSAERPAGSPHDMGHTRYPGVLRDCSTCHDPATITLPLPASVRPSRLETLTCTEDPAADGDSFCNTRVAEVRYLAPATAVCTSCHDGDSTQAHAEVMTTALGKESCATCHGRGSAFDPARVHTLDPVGAP